MIYNFNSLVVMLLLVEYETKENRSMPLKRITKCFGIFTIVINESLREIFKNCVLYLIELFELIEGSEA